MTAPLTVSTAQLFTEARTAIGYKPDPVPDTLLHELYELMKWAPTSANSSPARIAFVRTPEGKARLVFTTPIPVPVPDPTGASPGPQPIVQGGPPKVFTRDLMRDL
jgi:hypothetical protein